MFKRCDANWRQILLASTAMASLIPASAVFAKTKQPDGDGRVALQLTGVSSEAATATTSAAPDESAVDTNGTMGDIVVMARGRIERLEDVPVAASVLSGSEVDRVGNNIASLSTLVPSLRVSRAGAGNGGSVSLRGVASSIANASLEQKVALNLDGVQMGRARVLTQGFFDTKSVQVLKGPQALFFGKNATAGVLSLESNDPSRKLEGYVRAGYETEASEYAFEGAVSVPITEELRVRIAGRFSDMTEGYLVNDAPVVFQALNNAYNQVPYRHVPQTRSALGRITLVYEPSSDLNINLKVTGGDSRTTGSKDAPAQPVCAPGASNQGVSGGGFPEPWDDCVLNDHIVQGSLPAHIAAGYPESRGGLGFTNLRTWLGTLRINYNIGNLALTSITGVADLKSAEFGDSSGSAYSYAVGGNSEHYRQITQELRLASDFDGPLNFTVGALFERTRRSNTTNGLTSGGIPADPRNGRTNSFLNLLNGRGHTYSAFAQLNWKILPQIELAGGARYSHDDRRGNVRNTFVNQAQVASYLTEGIVRSNSVKFDNVSPEVTLSWKPYQGLMAYAGYRSAALPGGISSPSTVAPSTTDASLIYLEEKARGFEGGIKFVTLNNRLRGDLTAFHFDYTDLQVSAFNPVTLNHLLTNAGKARSKGIEGSLNFRPIPELTLRAEATYAETKFVTYVDAQCYSGQTPAQGCAPDGQDLSGRPLPRAPKFAISGGISYEVPMFGDWNLGLRGDVRHSSGYFAAESENPNSFQKAFTTIDLSATLHNELWEVAVIGRNIGNTFYATSAIDQPRGRNSQALAIVGRPREVVFQLTRRF